MKRLWFLELFYNLQINMFFLGPVGYTDRPGVKQVFKGNFSKNPACKISMYLLKKIVRAILLLKIVSAQNIGVLALQN